MVLMLELINPMYLVICFGVFMIIVCCACYGCHDILYNQAVNATGVIACDVSDCEIPGIHEQHAIEKKGESMWGKKAWGMEPDSDTDGLRNGNDLLDMSAVLRSLTPTPMPTNAVEGEDENLDISANNNNNSQDSTQQSLDNTRRDTTNGEEQDANDEGCSETDNVPQSESTCQACPELTSSSDIVIDVNCANNNSTDSGVEESQSDSANNGV